jgi:hypothetical protein
MTAFDLTKAAELQLQQNGQLLQIWAVFVTATFAAALLNVSATKVRWEISAAVTLGFGLFAYGHFTMLRAALEVSQALSADMIAHLPPSPKAHQPDVDFGSSLRAIAKPSFKAGFSYCVHVLIDACVVAAIWAKHFQKKQAPALAPPKSAA